jgi:hypothetical protein
VAREHDIDIPTPCHCGYGVDHTWHRVDLMKKLLAMCGLERK